MSQSFAPNNLSESAPAEATPWLICVETQRLHFAPEHGPVGAPFYAKVDACRRVLGHARRNHWRVVHVHRRRIETPAGHSDPELRPIEGLEPLPTERVYVRQADRPLTCRDDPFWRDALNGRGAEMLMAGHLTARAIAQIAMTGQDVGVDVMMIEEAIWRRAPETPFDRSSLPLMTLKRLESLRVRRAEDYGSFSFQSAANSP